MVLRAAFNLGQCSIKVARILFHFHSRLIAIPLGTKLQRILGLNKAIQTDILFKGVQFQSRKPLLLLWTLPFLASRDEQEGTEQFKTKLLSQTRDITSAIHKADNLFECNKYEDAISVLFPFKDSKDVEVLWRLGRAQYNLSKSTTVPETDKRRLIYEAYDAVLEALELDDEHWAAHKWMSVLLDARATYDGIKARVSQLERVKLHMLKASELNPKDATTLYMIGLWCYEIADMPWFQRKIAATIFAAPPTSSFEEALYYFSKAEEIEPKFYSKNLLMMGKTLLKLERAQEASSYLTQARDFPITSEEDDLVKKEASELLKTLKVG